ncbi:oligosaccharide flippase family protein [Pseudomonas vanderleydeniana]|uniref:Oligosaccharide flippase family protein n=1 Tax=Pseudomonas vanderleydeniana TaxID=2745495 RepID=A0A9E6PQ80_9PSED|nr:oligosaccharide flippase family protein [Pseudomonas vanderleydeniana]QXI30220.1 oligosaccharide flippase family protein [Pseudomonas vanderleydeniana]
MLRKDLKNIASLACIQGSNAVLPIFIFPYMLHLFGAEKYASLAVSEAISLIILTVVLYSFEVNGISRVVNACSSGGVVAASDIYCEVFFSRMIIWSVCLLVVLVAGIFLQVQFFLALLAWMLVPLAYIFQSTYFYQAIESNMPVAVFTLLSRLVCLIGVFLLSKPEMPIYMLPLIVGGCYLIGGIASAIYLKIILGLEYRAVTFGRLLQCLLDGKEIFFGNASVVLFRDSNLLILNLLSINPIALSAYSVVEKFIKAFQALIRPLNQFFYTRSIKVLGEKKTPDMVVFFKIMRLTWVQLLALLLALVTFLLVWWFFEDDISFIASYPEKQLMAHMFLVMVVGVFFGVANFMLGTAGLNNLGARRYFASSLILTGCVTVTACVVLANYYEVYGAVVSFVMGEIILFCLILKKYLQSWGGRSVKS